MGAEQNLDQIIDSLRAVDVDAVRVEDLASTLVSLRERIDWLEGEWTRRVAAFDRAQGRNLEGHASTTAFLKHRCQMAGGRAHRAVALGHRLVFLPQAEKMFASGDISLDQVRLLARVPERLDAELARDEVTLTNAITGLSAAHTRHLIDYWQTAVDGPGAETDAAEESDRRYFYLSQTFEGMFKGDFLLDRQAGETLATALSALTPPRSQDEERSAGQRRADALVDLARLALDSGQLPGTEKPHLLVLTDIDALCGSGGGTHETMNGTVLTPDQIRQFACDCNISRIVFGSDSQPIDIGRKSRIIPPAMAKAVIARDRHCQWPGCDRPARWTDIHHVIHWADGGPTAIWNLTLLCRYHHTLQHRQDAQPRASTAPAAHEQHRTTRYHLRR